MTLAAACSDSDLPLDFRDCVCKHPAWEIQTGAHDTPRQAAVQGPAVADHQMRIEPAQGAHHLVLVGEGKQRREHGAEGKEQELEEEQADRVLRILQVRLLRDVEPEQTCRS